MRVHKEKSLPSLQIRDGDYMTEVNGAPTMYGVVNKYPDKIAANWTNENTIKQYSRYCNDIILPEFGNAALETITITELDAALEKYVEENPGTPSGKNRPNSGKYARSTVFGSIMGCIRRIFWVAEDEGICRDLFWLNQKHVSWGGAETDDEDAVLPKSIPPQLEKELLAEVFRSPEESGRTIGISLMAAFGLRNEEACDIRFSNFHHINNMYLMTSHTSVDSETAKQVIGGKTYNMFRILMLPEVVYNFYMDRKAFIQKKIDEGSITFGSDPSITCIDQIPVACDGENFTKLCTTRALTQEGRRILHRAGLNGADFQALYRQAAEADRSIYGKTKDATAYLFRRSFGEHLHDLGMSDEAISYLMGHVIENERLSRSNFRLPKLQMILYDRYEYRPFYLYGDKDRAANEDRILEKLKGVPGEVKEGFKAIYDLPCDGKRYRLVAISNEPTDPMTAYFKYTESRKHDPVTITTDQVPIPQAKDRTACVARPPYIVYDYLKRYDIRGID